MPSIHFKGKSIVQYHHLAVPYRQLLPDAAKSVTNGEPPSLKDNLILHGDNLSALKALLPSFAGRVKCIYIDPPYNTGNERWVYNDNVNSPMHQEWLGKVVDKEDLTRHDKWLCMMWPRLTLLRELLRDDGVIFISIDDNEIHRLRMMLDEVFGEQNFIAQLVWEKGRKNDAKLFSVGHEYAVAYARSMETLRANKTVWREAKPGAKEIWDEYSHLRQTWGQDNLAIEKTLQEWFSSLPARHPSKRLSRYRHVDEYGPWRDRDISWPGGGGPRYDVLHPVTKQPCRIPEAGWRFATPEKMQEQIDLGLVVFRETHEAPPFRKAHLRPVYEELDTEDMEVTNGEAISDQSSDEGDDSDLGLQVMPSVVYKQSQVAVKYLRNLMGKKAFENPKDHEVLMRLIRYVTDKGTGDIILDSFAGSGTTAHAVLALNAEDGGNRQFILVEQEDYADSLTAERVRRVIRGVPGAKDAALRDGLGGTFSYVELGEPYDEARLLSGDRLPSYEDLARYTFFTATGEQWDASQMDRARSYLGESARYQVYLLYEPDLDTLKNMPLNLSFVKDVLGESFARGKDKPRLVIAPLKYLDEEAMACYGVEYCQLPFGIYKFKA